MNAKKIVTAGLALVMVAGISVAGTLAFLTSSDSVQNTFTVGKVAITLDEAPVGADGKEVAGDRVKANTYKLMPGHDYDKDPTVHVDASSEAAYLFVKVENGIADIEDESNTIADQMDAKGWDVVATNVYAYEAIVNGGDNVTVFETFKISGDVEGDVLEAYQTANITVTAYAIQADGFSSAADAWSAYAAQELGE